MTYLIAYCVALAIITAAVSVAFWLVTGLLVSEPVDRVVEQVWRLLR